LPSAHKDNDNHHRRENGRDERYEEAPDEVGRTTYVLFTECIAPILRIVRDLNCRAGGHRGFVQEPLCDIRTPPPHEYAVHFVLVDSKHGTYIELASPLSLITLDGASDLRPPEVFPSTASILARRPKNKHHHHDT
jgi:hypothetical protein